MSRRGRRGTDGAQDEGAWLPDEYDDAGGRTAGRRGSRQRRADPSGPPWETGGWETDTGSWQAPGAAEPDWQAHPSFPLPADPRNDPHPSGPLPGGGSGWHTGQGDWAPDDLDSDRYQPGRYPGAGAHGDYPSGGYPAGDYAGGGYGTGGYPAEPGYGPGSGAFPGGAPASGEYPAGDYASGEYPAGDYPAGDYPAGYGTGGYPAEPDYAGGGFGEPAYQQDYAPGSYRPDDGTEAEDAYGGAYRDDSGGAGYPARDSGNHPGYPDRGGWYGDVDEQQAWTGEDEADSGFLPALSGDRDGRRRDGGRPARGGRAPARPVKRRGGARRIMPRVFLGLLLVILLGGGGAGYYVWTMYLHPADYTGAGTGTVVVQIKPGDTATAVGQRLQQLGVVASARAFANAATASKQGSALEPGFYRLHRHMQASLAFALLLNPASRDTVKVLIPEGLRLSQIIATLGKDTGNLAGYQAAIKNTAALGLPSYANGNPEGFLFPATYTIQHGTPPLKVLQEMVQRFGQTAGTVKLPAAAKAGNLTQRQAIIVASLVQAEGGRLQDYPKIARVIYNRWSTGMMLQLDSTVMYALNTYGIIASNTQLNVKSPYNTYRHFGLPPGPIDSPGQAAIEAALHPARGTWLYFVTVDPKTGVTKFTSDPNVFAQLRAELQQNIAHGK